MTGSGKLATYPGIYRGTVTINIDPEFRGRLQLLVPDVLTFSPSSWAEPCTPLAGPTGPGMGVYMVPPPGAAVWVMFEHGDPDQPVAGLPFSICRRTCRRSPKSAIRRDPNIVLQTTGQNMIMVSDAPPTPVTGGIVLKSTTGAMIVVNDSGIYISNGKGALITMIGPTINFNLGALIVT
jgi:hypothetical protein